MALLSFTHILSESSDHYEVIYENGVYLGDIVKEVDGFYVYYPEIRGGYWSSHMMREIADKIDELDAPWQKEMDKYWAGLEVKTPVVVEN